MLTEIVLGFFLLWQMEASVGYWTQYQCELPERDYPYTDEVVIPDAETIYFTEE